MKECQKILCAFILVSLYVLSTYADSDEIDIDINGLIPKKNDIDSVSANCAFSYVMNVDLLEECTGLVIANIKQPMKVQLGKINNATFEGGKELISKFEFALCCAFHLASECGDELEVRHDIKLYHQGRLVNPVLETATKYPTLAPRTFAIPC